MTPQEFSIEVVQQLTEAGHVAYWAGGCVRDLLRGVEPNDFDVATDATPDQVRKLFGKHRTLAVGESFGVIILLGPESAGQVEIATFRSEGEYLDGRRPESVAFCTPEQDAHRRDFTINGMFYDPLRQVVHDFVDGQTDLQARLVRAIGDPHDRMSEDKLRMLRAVRFAAVLDFELDFVTANAVQEMASQIVVVSAERIAQEFKKMLMHTNRARAMRLCETLGLMQVILPEVVSNTIQQSLEHWESTLSNLQYLTVQSFEAAFAILLGDVTTEAPANRKEEIPGSVRAICRRLKLSNAETDQIHWLVQHRETLKTFPELSLAAKKQLAVAEHFTHLLDIESALIAAGKRTSENLDLVQQFLADTPFAELSPPELITGQDLIDLGYKPGPKFNTWLRAVREAQLNNEISTREQAVAIVQSFASEKLR